jgi:FtsZ-binding cell division protein ZapB
MDNEMLNRLEEKVRAALEKMEELRQENRRLTRQLQGSKGDAREAPDHLEEQLQLLQDERATVRSRIEGLIDWMEASS